MPINKERLISLAVWAAGEDAKRRLGLPSEWHQGQWLSEAACGTACCVAGKVALEDGGQPVRHPHGWLLPASVTFPGRPGTEINISEYARKVLGLDLLYQGDLLFSATNDLDDVLRIIAELIGTDAAEASS